MEFEAGQYDIWARNGEYERIDQVADFKSLTLDLKWDDMSTWSLELPTKEFLKRWQLSGIYGSLLVPEGGCGLHGAPYGVLIIRNNSQIDEAILSGIIINAERKYDGFTDTMTLSGECDTSFMRTRNIWPDPRSSYDAGTGWWSADGTIASDDTYGACESVISYYTQYNLGEYTSEERRLAYFGTSTDQMRGEYVQYQGRFQVLFDACLEILHSQAAPITTQSFEIKQVADHGSTRLQYNWRDPVDKTNDAIFGTELGTISSFDYKEALPKANYILVGGPNYDSGGNNSVGAGTDTFSSIVYVFANGQTTNTAKRMYTDMLNETSAQIYGRREGFADYGGNLSGDASTDPTTMEPYIIADMQTQALKSLTEGSYAISATVDLLPFEGPEFMSDWALGDIVKVTIGAGSGVDTPTGALHFQEVIREVNITVSPTEGEKIVPTICDSMKFTRASGAAGQRALAATKTIQTMGGKLK